MSSYFRGLLSEFIEPTVNKLKFKHCNDRNRFTTKIGDNLYGYILSSYLCGDFENQPKTMPKVLQVTLSSLWIFSFFNTDVNENRTHVHAGHRGTRRLAKIWLEPNVCIGDIGELNQSEANEALKIAKQYHSSGRFSNKESK